MADDPDNKERGRAVSADHRQVISMTVNATAAAVGLCRRRKRCPACSQNLHWG